MVMSWYDYARHSRNLWGFTARIWDRYLVHMGFGRRWPGEAFALRATVKHMCPNCNTGDQLSGLGDHAGAACFGCRRVWTYRELYKCANS